MTEIVGNYHAICVPLFVDCAEIVALLSDRHKDVVRLASAEAHEAIPSLEQGKHPVLVEMGYQTSTGPSLSSLLRSSFYEHKVTIPYLHARDSTQLISLKYAVLLSSSLNAFASRTFLGMRCFAPDHSSGSVADHYFTTNRHVDTLTAKFDFDPAQTTLSHTSGITHTLAMIQQPFFNPFGKVSSLSSLVYDTKSLQVTPIKGSIEITGNVLSDSETFPVTESTFEPFSDDTDCPAFLFSGSFKIV